MRRLSINLLIILVALALSGFLSFTGTAWAAGSVVVSQQVVSNFSKQVIFTCTGDASTGAITNTDTGKYDLSGWYLYRVITYPTSGGTAPDAADVFILDANSLDLLGCEDGSTTAYQGLNLIHATLARSAIPDLYIPRAGLHQPYYPLITGPLTLKVANQGKASANYTVVLELVK